MLVAGGFDGRGAGGRPFFTADRPRLVDPEERCRVVGYLAGARPVGPGGGYRTDGVWVWPESLADHARDRGVGPQAQLLDYMRSQRYRLPDEVPPALLAEAARASVGPVTPSPPPARATYLAATVCPPGGQPRVAHVLRRVRRCGGTVADEMTMPGLVWRESDLLSAGRAQTHDLALSDISEERAGRLLDELCAREHADELRFTHGVVEEGAPVLPQLARVFDQTAPNGRPYFTPSRLRIVDRERRECISDYLTRAPLAVRSLDRAPDPLAGDRRPVVPLGYRTDGVWVWPEALGYYLRTRGIAPEFPLLARIESCAYRPPAVDPLLVARAADVVRHPPPVRPRPAVPLYYTQRLAGRSGPLVRAPRRDIFFTQVLDPDLRWRDSDALWRNARTGEHEYVEITEDVAADIVDDRWQRHRAVHTVGA
jgi:hypothetical protein